MKVTFRDDIQDGMHKTAVIRVAGYEWETQVDIDAIPELRKTMYARTVFTARDPVTHQEITKAADPKSRERKEKR